jgi:hypothetical protein
MSSDEQQSVADRQLIAFLLWVLAQRRKLN